MTLSVRPLLACASAPKAHMTSYAVAAAVVMLVALLAAPSAHAQTLQYTTPDRPIPPSTEGPTTGELIYAEIGRDGVNATIWSLLEGCNLDLYSRLAAAVKVEYDEDDNTCLRVVDGLTKRQFGPPNDWEIFQVTCQGPCLDNFYRVREVYEEAGCSCPMFQRVLDYQEIVTWTGEPVIPPCLKYHTDHLCKQLQICKDPHSWHRHGCRGCGWEAITEDQWIEERDPDFGCGAPGVSVLVVLAMVAAVTALQAWLA